MIDDMNSPESQTGATTRPGIDPAGRAAYCQECGRGLTADTLRHVGNGIFCDPCAALRQGARPGQPFNGYGYPGGVPYGVVPPASSEPNPVLAGFLGLIPGVGAMFNGQYAKSAMHLIVFVVLLTVADNLNWVFYWLVWGWVFYQAFDAYHTARARRDNLPLPNPFGWNDIGERFGFNRSASPPASYPPPANAQAPTNAQARRDPGANWAGYISPSSGPVPTQPFPPYVETPSQNPYTAPYAPPQAPPVQPPPTNVPYAPTFTGHNVPQVIHPSAATSGTRRFPVGALWLIVLGMLFLVGNLQPGLRLSGRWLVPVLLAALSFWMAVRRWDAWRSTSAASTSLAGAMTAPVMLLTVSFLLALQAAHLFSLHRSWPVLLVVWGALLLIQRSAAAFHPATNVVEMPSPAPPPVRSTSGTGSLGL